MRKTEFLNKIDAIACSDPDRCRRPLAHAVDREHGRILEWRREKRACGMRLVVLNKHDSLRELAAQAASNFTRMVEFRVQPLRDGVQERPKAAGANDRYVSSSRSNLSRGFS